MGNYAIAITGGSTTKSHSVHPKLSFAEIQAAVRAGHAKDYFDIGQELMTHYTYNGTVYNMPWVVLDNNRECVWPDGSLHPGLWIGSKYATIESVQFDAPESTTVDLTEEPNALEGWYYWVINQGKYSKLNVAVGDALPTSYDAVMKCFFNHLEILRHGYNRYLHCALRQWLNSDETVGNWWAAQHTGDQPPSQLSTINGFMCGLDQDFLAVINPVKIQAATNTLTDEGVTDVMYDRFFLQSVEEVYGQPQASDVEGPYFPYWKNVTGLNVPSNGGASGLNNAREIARIDNPTGDPVRIHLRSAALNSRNNVYDILPGQIVPVGAGSSEASLPAACIS